MDSKFEFDHSSSKRGHPRFTNDILDNRDDYDCENETFEIDKSGSSINFLLSLLRKQNEMDRNIVRDILEHFNGDLNSCMEVLMNIMDSDCAFSSNQYESIPLSESPPPDPSDDSNPPSKLIQTWNQSQMGEEKQQKEIKKKKEKKTKKLKEKKKEKEKGNSACSVTKVESEWETDLESLHFDSNLSFLLEAFPEADPADVVIALQMNNGFIEEASSMISNSTSNHSCLSHTEKKKKEKGKGKEKKKEYDNEESAIQFSQIQELIRCYPSIDEEILESIFIFSENDLSMSYEILKQGGVFPHVENVWKNKYKPHPNHFISNSIGNSDGEFDGNVDWNRKINNFVEDHRLPHRCYSLDDNDEEEEDADSSYCEGSSSISSKDGDIHSSPFFSSSSFLDSFQFPPLHQSKNGSKREKNRIPNNNIIIPNTNVDNACTSDWNNGDDNDDNGYSGDNGDNNDIEEDNAEFMKWKMKSKSFKTDLYCKEGEVALGLKNRRDYYFNEASLAYQRKEKSRSQTLVQKGLEMDKKFIEAQRLVGQQKFKECNLNLKNNITIDLHRLHVEQAVKNLELHINLLENLPNILTLTIITGIGRHSPGGEPRIKPAVISYLHENGIKKFEDNGGRILLSKKHLIEASLDLKKVPQKHKLSEFIV